MFSTRGVPVPCGDDPEIFFSNRESRVERAKEMCGSCLFKVPCLEECLEYEALAQTVRVGVFGGLTPEERTKLMSKRRDRQLVG